MPQRACLVKSVTNKLIILGIILLVLVSGISAQDRITLLGVSSPVKSNTQFPGWLWKHDTFDSSNGTTNGACASGTTCTITFVGTTSSSKSAWALYASTSNSVQILRACTNDSTCSSTNDNWQTCGASCQATQGSSNIALAYNVNGTVSSSSFTVVLNNPSGTSFLILFVEMIPPSGFLPAFDAVATATSASCTTCTLAAPTVSGTDAVVHWPLNTGSISTISPASSPYFQDFNGPVIGQNITSSTAPTLTQASGSFADAAVSFKTTSAFTADSKNSFFTLANATLVGQLSQSCSAAGCSLTIPSTTAGNLIFIHQLDSSGNEISSVSDAGADTFSVPAGCAIIVTGLNESQSCAYTLSVTGGTTSLTVKMAATTGTNSFAIYEFHRQSGSWVNDFVGSQQNGHTATPAGVSLTLTGANGDVAIQGLWSGGGANDLTYYPISWNNLTGGNGPAVASGGPNSVAVLNIPNSFPNMTWYYGSSVQNTASIGVAFK